MLRHPRLLALVAVVALALPSCTRSPAAAPAPSTPTPTPSATRTLPPKPAAFDADRTMDVIEHLSVTIGIREAGSRRFREAADYAAEQLASFGYRVGRQTVPLPAGVSQGVAVPAGETQNIIAKPRGYDPTEPHLLVGGHLDTVAVTPGANDNASGAAVVLELARLASITPAAMPIVFVLFGGEERRLKGDTGATFGSRFYLSKLAEAEGDSLKAMLAIDMVGAGPKAYVCHQARTGPAFVDAFVATGKRLKLPSEKRIVFGVFSDHGPFENAGYTVAWLWSGEHDTLHTPRDTFGIVQRSSIARIGRIAWETLRTVRL